MLARIWARFTNAAKELNLKTIHLDLNAPLIYESYNARWHCHEEEPELPSLWFAEIPLMALGQVIGRVEIAGWRDDRPVWNKIAILTKLAEDAETIVTERVEEMRKPAALRPVLAAATAEVDPARIS